MKLRAITNFLMLIYGLSITAFGIMEIGHEALHSFKNAVHHHEADHHHILEDHDIQLDDSTDTIDNILSSLSFNIAFYESCTLVLINVLSKPQYQLQNAAKTITVACSFFVPPRIGI
ncbi:MAG TPA: hypothetical protein VE467_10650 [Chryseolinea sp.]|jgi:hypothetical protein|nr:hypothetical protein [Chryseolinea sp.]